MNLSAREKILLSAFQAHDVLHMHDIPGQFSVVVADLIEKGLVEPHPERKAAWRLTKKGRLYRSNPPRRKMYLLPYRYEIQFSEDGELFGEPLKFRSEQDISDFMKDYPHMKMESMRKLEPEISEEENPANLEYTEGDNPLAIFDEKKTTKGIRVSFYLKKSLKDSAEAKKVLEELYPGGKVKEFYSHKLKGSYGALILFPKGKHNPPISLSKYTILKNAQNEVKKLIEELHYHPEERPTNLAKRLSKIYQDLTFGIHHLYKTHISEGHYKGGKEWTENPPSTEVYRDIIEIKARKADGRLYKHNFQPGSSIFGLADGSILIKSRKGKKLWKNFPKGRK